MRKSFCSISFVPILLLVGSCSSPPAASYDNRGTPTATPAPYIRDGKGNVIKSNGWELPDLGTNKTYAEISLTKGGGKIKGQLYSFVPKEKMLVTIPKSWEDGDITYKVDSINEIKGEGQPPYCYQFYVNYDWPDPANHPGVSTFFSYHDDDGDGIFETLSDGCTVPSWVK